VARTNVFRRDMINETLLKNAEKPIRKQGLKQELSLSSIFTLILFVLEKPSGNFSPLFL
jgi:hypothetical protein